MMQVIDDNPTNWLVLTDDGTETKTKSSSLNQLLYGHDLWGLISDGTEIWQKTVGDKTVRIIPDDNAECYTIQLESGSLTLPASRKTDLVDALAAVYNDHDGDSVEPIISLFDRVRGNMMRPEAVEPFLDAFSDKVEERDDGWLVNGHLLLTYEGDFYHPDNVTRNRSGSVIGTGLAVQAYGLATIEPDPDMNRNVGDYRLTDKELRFVTRVLWAVDNTPDQT